MSKLTLGAISFFTWFAGALVSRAIADADTLTTAVWLASGIAFGLALAARRWNVMPVLAGAGLAGALLSWIDGNPPLGALAFGVNEALSVAAGVAVARLGRSETPGVVGAGPLAAYALLVLGALVTAALGASIATALWSWVRPEAELRHEWIVWATSVGVGVLLMAPLIEAFAGFRPRRSGGLPMSGFAAGALAFAVFVAAAALVFRGDGAERFGASVAATLAYLPLPFIVFTAVLWGARGGLLAVLVGAVLLIGWTDHGGGPFSVAEGFAGEAVIEVQGYVAVMALLVGVVLALGAARERALADAQAWRLRYRQALDSNRGATVLIDAVTGRFTWSEGAAAVLGRSLPATVSDWIAASDPAEQPLLQSHWSDLVAGRLVNVEWRFEPPGGARRVRAQLAAVQGPDGTVEQVAGLAQAMPDEATA